MPPTAASTETHMTDVVPVPEHPDLSIDQQVALRTAATNLGRQLGDIYGTEAIERSGMSALMEASLTESCRASDVIVTTNCRGA